MNETIKGSQDAARIMLELLNHEQEHLYQINLNNANKVVGIHLISIGSDTQTIVPIKFIAKKAILDNAAGVILCHNHPSGNCSPSVEDIKQTKRTKEALSFFEIKLLDHIILSRSTYYSFCDEKKSTLV